MKTTIQTAGANCARAILAILPLVFFVATVQAQTQIVYDDILKNGWADFSYGVPDCSCSFTNTTTVHTGTNSIAYTPIASSFNEVSIALPTVAGDTSTATYPVLHFWINGGATGGQLLGIALGLGDDANGQAETQLATGTLNDYVSGGVAASTWHEVTVNLTQLSPPYNGPYDRFDIYSLAGDQSPVYIDDVTLTQAGPPPAVSPLAFTHDIQAPVIVPDAREQMNSDIITWYDSGAQPRKATLAHDAVAHSYAYANAGTGTIYGVAMRELQYQLSNGTTRVARYTGYGNGGFGGFGYVTDHSSRFAGCAGDDSPLGDQFPPSGFQRIFEGRHHAIYRMTQNYRRNCATTAAAVAAYSLPVTIDWVFSTGHDHPLWAITYDVDLAFKVSNPGAIAPEGTFFDDSRAPYGEFGIDGAGFTNISGVGWGDYRNFTSDPNAATLTLDTSWTWNAPNTIPFVKEWIAGVLDASNHKDATMGTVQTQTNALQDAAGARDPGVGSDIRNLWDTVSGPANLGCPGTGHSLPCPNDWPYQALANSLESEPAGTANARMTWKTQYGFIGQHMYDLNDLKNGSSGTAPGYKKKSYSTYIVLGQHSINPEPVDDQVAQVSTVQSVTFTNVLAGTVVTTGPAGNVRADNVMYNPAGYNHVYGALALSAAGNNADVTINVTGTLKKPLIIVSNYTAANPTVKLGGVTLIADADYFASLRMPASELWITLNSNLTGAGNHLEVLGAGGGAPGTPTGVVATASSSTQVDITWTVPVGGADFYEVERASSLAGGYMQVSPVIMPPTVSSFSDMNAMPNTAYLYRVRAVTGGVMSAPSTPDLATTATFTNNPLAAGMTVQAIDLSQDRSAIDEVRALADKVAYAYTNTGVAGTTIQSIDITEMRAALDDAMMALGGLAGGYTNSAGVTTPIRAIDFQELRTRIR